MVKKVVKKSVRKPVETPEQREEFLKFLLLAKQTENEGLKFYTEVKKKINDYNMHQLIKVIIEQEKEHLRIVTEVYNAEKNKGISEVVKIASKYNKQKKLKTPVDSMKHIQDFVKKKATIYRLFQKAIEFEEGISKIYLDMAKAAKNPRVKSFLKKLAGEELMHKEFIKMHQDSIYNSGHWYGWDHVRLQT